MKKISIAFVTFLILSLLFIFLPQAFSEHIVASDFSSFAPTDSGESLGKIKTEFKPSYASTPDKVEGIYMTSWVSGTPSLRNKLVDLIGKTELNSVVIDIKDYSGKIVFPIDDNPSLKAYGSEEVRVSDMRDFIESLHSKGIYVIARLAVFQDAYMVKARPYLAVKNKAGTLVWKDRKGISWIDPGSREYWDYIVAVAEEARKIGFDEVNFDYIRFPSDGNMQDISYPWSSTTPKAVVMKSFFSYLHDKLVPAGVASSSDRLKISADLFGMTTTMKDDMGIGQIFTDALPYFDYVSPMIYPSHYYPGFLGYKNPEEHPYEVVHYALQSAVSRRDAIASSTPGVSLGEVRPWLQVG
jgi:hypothetical protein